ncbi:bestrophin family protein [Terriglobus aquaticus]|uniref:Bestrophin family protein n=1 Tax=Terriglobus aquaticus TaxID=940139 RepID=A0ABW9KH17_9BACT|nr:bestrophin family protein [Terriglobus aquaticus]
MIVRDRPSVWQLFVIYRLSILRQIVWQVLSVAAFSAWVVAASQRWPATFRSFSVAPFTLLGIALSIFLGFRNSACYERWWEARRQLGALIGVQRSLARLTRQTAPDSDQALAENAILHQIAYTYSLMAHLRDQPTPAEAAAYALPPPASAVTLRNLPDSMLQQLAAVYASMMRRGNFGEMLYCRFDERLTELAAIQVACERIKGTPTPFTYTLLLHRTAYAFCFLLPFGLAQTFHYGTILFCSLVAYAFFGLDTLGDDLQEPFGNGLNALPLSAMARTVEISLLQILGRTPLPLPLQPIDSILR